MSILCVKPLITCIPSQLHSVSAEEGRGHIVYLVVFLGGGEKGSGVHVYTLHSKYCVNLPVHSAMFMLGRGVVTQCMITKIM